VTLGVTVDEDSAGECVNAEEADDEESIERA